MGKLESRFDFSEGMHFLCDMKSGLHASGEGERVIALESWEGNLASRRVEEGLSRSFSVEAGNPGFPRLVQVTSGGFSWWL